MATLPYDTNALIAQTKAMLDQTKAQGTTAFAGSSYDKGFQGGVQLGNTGAPSATGYNPVQTVSPTGVVYNSTVGTPPPVPKTMDASSIASSLGGDNTALDTTGDKFVLPSSDILNVDNGVTDMMSIKPSDILASLTDTQGEKESKTISETLAGLFKKQGTQKAETIQAENAMGIPAMQNQLRDLNNQILQTQTQAAQAMMTSEDRLAPTFAIRGEQAQIERMRATKALGLNALAQAVQGNIASAQSSVDRMIELEFAPIEAEIEYQKQMLNMNEAKLSRTEAKKAEVMNILLDERKRVMTEQKADKSDISTLALNAVANYPGNAQVQQAAQKAMQLGNLEEAVALVGQYQKDPMTVQKALLDMQNTRSMIKDREESLNLAKEKLALDKQSSTVEGSMSPEELVAWSKQYEATGAVTGLPKGTFGIVASIAKESKKQPGTIVNKVTGVADSKIGATEQADYSRLTNIIKNVERLKKLDEERTAGVVYGLFSDVLGQTDAQAGYNALRKSIIDDMQRMQSGAALTVDETAFYGDYLPGKYSEPFGLGTDSMKKITQFESFMKNRLNERLDANNLSVYGYSKVKVGDKMYTVGEELQNADGVRARVGANGELFVIPQ